MKKEVLYRGQKYKVLKLEKVLFGTEEANMLTLSNKKYKMLVNEKYVVYC